MTKLHTRRDLIKLAASAAAIARPAVNFAQSAGGEIAVRVTAGSKRYAEAPGLHWHPARDSSAEAIVIDPNRKFQEILGFGASFTDATCYMFNEVPSDRRDQLFHELFHPTEMGLSACRLCVGSSDYARNAYSFDEGDPDPEMRRFSIDHDRAYILPMLKLARSVNPDLFLLASPWSPPGWMKTGGSMLGGSMRKHCFSAYALYLTKFLQAYADAGVPVNALTVQNEVDADQDGKMPACLWGQEYEMDFIADHLGPLLAKNNIATKIWILDHNYSLWGRAICELDDPRVNRFVDGVAWHGYVGEDSAMTRVHDAHPEKHAYWTEGGPSYRDPHYQTDWAQWSTTFAGILRNWSRCIMGWNLALDEKGQPNIGPFDCGGVITIDSRTKEITRSGQYWALTHYSRAIRRGARRVESTANLEGVSQVAFANPDGTLAAVLTNSGGERSAVMRISGKETAVSLPADSMTTLTWHA